VPQLTGRPVLGGEARSRNNGPECSANVGGVQRCPVLTGEDQVLIGPPLSRLQPARSLVSLVRAKNVHRQPGQL
jgi:hypothetical protein